MAELRAGSIFAGHRIEGIAGRGGMGVVYVATHLALERRVALKLIAVELAEEDNFRERFQRESKIAASIDHPHVIPVYHAGEENDTLFITMRYIDGPDLRAVIKDERRLHPDRAVRIAVQVAEALDAAHARGLVHRDVKPGNILLVDRGGTDHVYLTDFGLTKRDASAASITGTGQIVGTLDYIAPEQVRGEQVDARTDVYALGCVLFHTLTGEVPFPADTYAAKLFSHLTGSAPRVTELAPDVPPALDAVVEKAMQTEPSDRYATAGELGAAALQAVRDNQRTAPRRTDAAVTVARAVEPDTRAHSQHAAAAEPDPPRPEQPPERGGRRMRALIAVGACLLAVAAAGVLAARRSGGEEVTRAEVRAVLDSYQASLTNVDLAAVERLLAPGFKRKLLADEPLDRAAALDSYRRAFRFRGPQPRYALTDVRVKTGDNGASATARYAYTSGSKPHLGDFGELSFHLIEKDGKVLIDRLESYPDVVALLPRTVSRADFPLNASLTATVVSRGERVPIAEGTSRLAQRSQAVIVPLSATGRRILHSGQDFRVRMNLELQSGRKISTLSKPYHFISGTAAGGR